MVEEIFKMVLDKLSDPLQLFSMVFILCLFIIVRMIITLLSRKEDILEALISELRANSMSVRQAVTLLEFLVYGKRSKE